MGTWAYLPVPRAKEDLRGRLEGTQTVLLIFSY
jgi:hypothetical protein